MQDYFKNNAKKFKRKLLCRQSICFLASLAGFISPVNISVLHNKGIFIIMKFACALNSIKVKRIKKETSYEKSSLN